jgi:DNA-binding NtrC family response regulator
MENIPTARLCILVVDPEYLVAMEAERILQGAGYSAIRIAMPWELERVLSEGRFGMVLIDAKTVAEPSCASLVRHSNAAVVIMSFRAQDLRGLPEWPGSPVVAKPFADEEVVQAVADAAQRAAASEASH